MDSNISQDNLILENKQELSDTEFIDVNLYSNTLNSARQMVQKEVETAKELLKTFKESDEGRAHYLKLVTELELLETHLDFTYNVLQSNSTEEVEALKDKSQNIKTLYEEVKKKEDLNIVLLHYQWEFLVCNLLPKINKFTLNSFEKDDKGSSLFKHSEENNAWAVVLAKKVEVINRCYSHTATYDKTDIFSHPKSSKIWQDLEKFVTFKRITSKESVEETMGKTRYFFQAAYAVIRSRTLGTDNPDFSSTLSVLKEFRSFMKQTARAEALSHLYLTDPQVDAFRLWNISEHSWISKMRYFTYEKVGYDNCIYVPRLFPRITKEKILQEFHDKTLNKIFIEPDNQLELPNLEDNKTEVLSDLFIEGEDKVQVRILSPSPLDLPESTGKLLRFARKATNLLKRQSRKNNPNENLDAIVIHIHGGGFVSGSSGTHRVYLNRWVNLLQTVVFGIDYRLAPKNPYPDAFDDVWQAYLWIVNYAEKILGIKNKKIILSGDSAGANLAMAIILRLIQSGLPVPHGCFLIYPSFGSELSVASPSRLLTLDNHIIPHGLAGLIFRSYVPSDCYPLEDPFIRGLVATDELLEKFPPVRIAIGDDDPLHDDSWRFLDRMTKLGKNVKMTIYNDLPHGFLAFENLKCHDEVVKDSCDLIQELTNQ